MSPKHLLALSIVAIILANTIEFGFIFSLIMIPFAIQGYRRKNSGALEASSLIIVILAVLMSFVNYGPSYFSKNSTEPSEPIETVQKTDQEPTKKEPTEEVPVQETNVYQTNEPITFDQAEVTVTGVEVKDLIGSTYMQKTPSEGGTYIAVNYTIKNIGKNPINAFSIPSIQLTNEQDVVYDSDVDANMYYSFEKETDNEKILSNLNPGITTNGSEVFEVSKELYNSEKWFVLINGNQKVAIK